MKRDLFRLAILWVISFAVYANSLGNAFISDDISIATRVPNPATILGGVQVMRSLVYYIEYLIGGMSPWVFRLGNIAFHIGTVTVLYLLVSKMANRTAGFISALLFAVHPMLVESVTWISGGVYAQYGFFFLLAFYFYIKAKEHKTIYIALCATAFILSLLTSEKAVVLPLILFVYEWLCTRKTIRWKWLLVFAGVSAVYLCIFYSNVNPRITNIEQLSNASPYWENPVIYAASAISMYVQYLIWPDGLTIYHDDPHMAGPELFLRVGVLVVFITGVAIYYRRNRLLCFWLLFSVLALSLTFSPYRITWIIAERYAYVATAGVTTSVALFLYPFIRGKSMRFAIWLFVVLATVALGIRTVTRNLDWKSDDTFWPATVKASPTNAKALNSLATFYAGHGDYQSAIQEFRILIALHPNYVPSYYNIALVYERVGDTEKAIENYEQALSLSPKDPRIIEALKRLGVPTR